ncbi:MAG: helix-turn-helix transcriptional regulator [Clostridia bacterium]|nr:helix-turn-helix transcriptional regulator [Clostridia bacterium]
MKRISDPDAPRQANITGRGIYRARREAGLSQKELSARLETMAVYICRGSLSRIEHGARLVTDIELDAIARALNVPVQRFFDEAFREG